MPQLINVPGMGQVSFPDGMSDEEIVNAIKKNTPIQNNSSYPDSLKPNIPELKKMVDLPQANMNPSLDFFRDLLYGIGKSGENTSKFLYGNRGQQSMPDIRGKNSNPMIVSMGQYLPFGIAGGSGLMGSTIASGAFGGTQYDPNQQGLIDQQLEQKFGIGKGGGAPRNAIEDAILNMALRGLGGSISKLFSKETKVAMPEESPFKQQYNFSSSSPNEFKNIPFQPPSFLTEKKPKALSPAISEDLSLKIMGNRTIEDSGKQLASHIHDTYKQIKNNHSKEFDRIFNTPTDEISYQTDEPILVKDKLIPNSKYKAIDPLENITDQGLVSLNENYMNTSNIYNGHKLQSELGSEIGYLKKQLENKTLDEAGKNKLSKYVNAQNLIQEDINDQLNNINPKLANEYNVTRENWRKNVIPYHTDKDLREIAEGRTKNPKSGQIKSIFEFPEENIDKVTSDLGNDAKDKILHIALGKVKEDLKPEELLNARKSLDLNGMSSYVNPEHEQSFRSLRANLQAEKERDLQEKTNQAFINGLKDIHEKINKQIINESKIREKKLQSQSDKSYKIMNDYQKEIMKSEKKLTDQEEAKKEFFKKMIKGSAGVAGVHALGLDSAEVLAAYLSTKFKK